MSDASTPIFDSLSASTPTADPSASDATAAPPAADAGNSATETATSPTAPGDVPPTDVTPSPFSTLGGPANTDVSPTVDPSLTPVPDSTTSTSSSATSADPGPTASTSSDTASSTTDSPSAPSTADAGPTAAGTGTDASDSSGSAAPSAPAADSTTTPSPAPDAASADLPVVDPTPANSPIAGDPTGTGTVPGKDGVGPVENQPVLDSSGPGVAPSVSLSPDPTTDTGLSSGTVVTPDIAPVREDQPTVDTIAAPAPTDTITSRTPNFHGHRNGDYVSIAHTDYIGQDPLVLEIAALEELIGLLQELRDASL